jgi:hypothetical protein
MVKIEHNLQEKDTLLLFIDRLMQGRRIRKGTAMKNIWGIFHLLMRFIAHLMNLLQSFQHIVAQLMQGSSSARNSCVINQGDNRLH